MRDVRFTHCGRKAAIITLIDCLKAIKKTLVKGEIKAWCDALKKGPLKVNLEWIVVHNTERLRQAVNETDLTSIEENYLPVVGAANDASRAIAGYLPKDDKAIDIALQFHGKHQDSPRLSVADRKGAGPTHLQVSVLTHYRHWRCI